MKMNGVHMGIFRMIEKYGFSIQERKDRNFIYYTMNR